MANQPSFEEFAEQVRNAGLELEEQELRKIYNRYRIIGWTVLISVGAMIGFSIYGVYKFLSRS